MNKDDKELFTKTNKKAVISLPYNFSYSGWDCTLSKVEGIKNNGLAPFDVSGYEYVIDAGLIVELQNSGTSGMRQYYKKGSTVEHCIKDFKELLLETNREDLKEVSQ